MPPDRSPGFRRRAGLLGLAGLGLPSLAPAARAQSAPGSWPDRPVRLVLPFGAGGAIDTLSRTVANAFTPRPAARRMVVENRGGAGGTIAGALVAQAKPDGSTLMMADLGANAIGRNCSRASPTTRPRLHPDLPPGEPAAGAGGAGLAAGAGHGRLHRLCPRHPDMVYAHPGIGYSGHLAQELFLRDLGLRMTPVPYRSGAEVAAACWRPRPLLHLMTVSTACPSCARAS